MYNEFCPWTKFEEQGKCRVDLTGGDGFVFLASNVLLDHRQSENGILLRSGYENIKTAFQTIILGGTLTLIGKSTSVLTVTR